MPQKAIMGLSRVYKHILLASDGSQESLVALREGALIARAWAAEVFLLIVEREIHEARMADGICVISRPSSAPELLARGLDRLRRIGVSARGEAVISEPAQAIAGYARRFGADLIVVGHRRQSVFERWWSGASGAYLVDHVRCSVMIARNVVTDREFEAMCADAQLA